LSEAKHIILKDHYLGSYEMKRLMIIISLFFSLSYVSAENQKTLKARDVNGLTEVTINQILINEEIVKANVLYKGQVESVKRQGKYIIYFNITIKNLILDEAMDISIYNFTLEDDQGYSYSRDQLTQDYINGSIHKGKKVRGGISFSIYKDSKPKKLLYNTGYESIQTGEKIYVIIDNLDKCLK